MTTNQTIHKIVPENANFPSSLHKIHQPPQKLYIMGAQWPQIVSLPKVAIVGSRKVSTYGKAVTQKIATELAQAGVVVVSGLAYGVDAVAHQAVLEANGQTIAVLPTSLDNIYPRGHSNLANRILAQGGALISEYAPGSVPHKGNFVERNRIVSGISDVLLVTEAAAKSGTLHTASFALDQGKEVFVVPGNITSPTSEGTNNLIKVGATPCTSSQDILDFLGMTTVKNKLPTSDHPVEQAIISALTAGPADGQALQHMVQCSIQQFNQALTMLEIKGIVVALGSNQWSLKV